MKREPAHGRKDDEITTPARMVPVAVDHPMPVEPKIEIKGIKISWQWGWPPIMIWVKVAPRRNFRVYEIRSQAPENRSKT